MTSWVCIALCCAVFVVQTQACESCEDANVKNQYESNYEKSSSSSSSSSESESESKETAIETATATATAAETTDTATTFEVTSTSCESETTESQLNCGPHEEEQCIKRCPPEKTCRNRGIMYRCARDDKPCQKKCVCKKGYFRNAIGQCITAKQCDRCNKTNEFYTCGSMCDNECSKIDSQNRTNCPLVNIKCNEGCYCDDGYARDGDGNCIPVEQCKKCGRNEIQKCVKPCPPQRTCRNRNAQYKCMGNLTCTSQCVCADGYYRNYLGECITKAQCDQCDKPNQFFTCGGMCDNECSKIDSQNRTNCPFVNIKCNEGCYCEDGYARDANRNCIPVDQCKSQLNCGPHEEEQCIKRCPPEKTCRNRDIMYDCARDDKPCQKKCVCKKGYFRNAIGQCITAKQCDRCNKTNEFYTCGSMCDNECSKIDSQNRTNCPLVNIKCNEGCYCDDGYARDGDGNCIPVEQCKKCGRNEIQKCVKPCPPQRTCRNRNAQYKCMGNLTCTSQCVCADGYYRNYLGECITKAQCDQCDKPNQFFTCGGMCDNECSKIDSQNRTNCPFVNIKCNEGCYCEDGYARDANRNCIPVDQCKLQLNCGPHEEEQCIKRCPPEKTCRNRDIMYDCARDDKPCQKKCVCKKGYFRNAIGQCITAKQCDRCNKTNEFYTCGSMCDNECSKIDSQNRTNCPLVNIKCNEGCYCDDGYARDGDGNCIPVDQCKKCGRNEVQKCVKPCPPQRTCRNRNAQYKCMGNLTCTSRCVCADGYYRNYLGECITQAQCDQCDKPNQFFTCGGPCDNECSTIDSQNRTNCPLVNIKCNEKCYCEDGYARDRDGNCIPVDQCKPPSLNCGPHEEEQCVKRCPPEKTCRNRGIMYRCARDDKPCQKKCVCKKGYFRNAIGRCITAKQCDICKKPNEFFACDSYCDNECININSQNRTNCPIKTFVCNEKCYCDDGFARDENGNCVPVDQCKRCGPNEVQKCVTSCPPERTCRNRNIKYLCKSGLKCTNKCVCAKGYLRNAIGQCITEKECEKCSCKENEEYVQEKRTCPPETCASIVSKYDCSKAPPPKPGCACKPGFLRHNETSPCIPICQCKEMSSSPECQKENCKDPNEEFVQEKQCCPPDTCEALVSKYDCSNAPAPKPGCTCKSGFRRFNGICIPVCYCPQMANSPECQKHTCNGPNEEYVKEKRTCPPETCISIVSRYDCSKAPPPKPGCACKPGFLRRNETSPCIPICQCKEMSSSPECQKENCKDPNEEFVQEKQCCPPDTCEALVSKYDCSNAPAPKPGCTCKSGFRRFNGICIPVCDCPQMANSPECQKHTCNGPNEEYVKEKRTCPPETCISIVSRYDCSKEPPPIPGCACKPGFLRRNETSPCIPICQCKEMSSSPECQKENCKDPNEEFVQEKQCCPPDTCEALVSKYDCSNAPAPKPGCTCKSGFRRFNGICIPVCNCPQMANSPECQKHTCNGPNEEYVKEKRTCPPETCISIVSRYDCSKEPPPIPGCACKPGFLRRNETSPCIPICQCKEMSSSPECQKENCKDPNEEFVQEKQCCPPDTCEALVSKYDCSNAPAPKPGCTCKSGFRRLYGICIPVCDCPQMANSPECQKHTCNGPNEEYVKEKRTCPPETCISIIADYDCRNAPPPKPGCACKPGFLRRNETSPCIPSCQCSEISSTPDCQKENCKDPNEEFVLEKQSCPPDSCVALVARYNCSDAPVPQPDCTCKLGYRRLNGTCVPLCKCPQMANSLQCKKPTCGNNEEYVQEKSTCPGDTCVALVEKRSCANAPAPEPGCVCISGFRRLKTGECVPVCECPEMKYSVQCQTPEDSKSCEFCESCESSDSCESCESCKSKKED